METTSGKIGLLPLAKIRGVGRQQQQYTTPATILDKHAHSTNIDMRNNAESAPMPRVDVSLWNLLFSRSKLYNSILFSAESKF